MREDTVLGLVEDLYAASLDPTGWDSFLSDLGDALGCSTTQLIVHDFKNKAGAITASVGFDPELQRSYDEYFAGINVFFKAPTSLTGPGMVYTGAMLCPDLTLEQSEYYNDFFRKLPAHHALGATIRGDKSAIAFISCLRAKKAGPFDNESIRLMQTLVPHLMRAMRLHQVVQSSELRGDLTVMALDCLPLAIMVLDSRSRPIVINEAARVLLAGRDGLVLEGEELVAAWASDTVALRALIAGAQHVCTRLTTLERTVLSINRRSAGPPLNLLVVPVRGRRDSSLDPAAAVLLFIAEGDRTPRVDPAVLARLYSLSPTEAKIACDIAMGASVYDIATSRHVAETTVRWHLKQVFRKTATDSQSDLTARVLTSVATVTDTADTGSTR